MNKGTLPIFARLRSLQTHEKFGLGGGRVIASAGQTHHLASLLQTVNETVLGRRLQFQSRGGASLTLEVAGRRVLRLVDANGLSGAENCLAAPVLDDEHKDELIKLIESLCSQPSELTVAFGPFTALVDGVSVGLPVALLADLLLVDLNVIGSVETAPAEAEVAPPPPELPAIHLTGKGVVDFASALGPVLVAWLIHGGEDSGRSDGPEEMVLHLQGFLDDENDAVRRQLDQLVTEPGSPVCLLLGATLVEGHSIICARMGEALLLGVIEGNGSQAALTAWNAYLR